MNDEGVLIVIPLVTAIIFIVTAGLIGMTNGQLKSEKATMEKRLIDNEVKLDNIMFECKLIKE